MRVLFRSGGDRFRNVVAGRWSELSFSLVHALVKTTTSAHFVESERHPEPFKRFMTKRGTSAVCRGRQFLDLSLTGYDFARRLDGRGRVRRQQRRRRRATASFLCIIFVIYMNYKCMYMNLYKFYNIYVYILLLNLISILIPGLAGN